MARAQSTDFLHSMRFHVSTAIASGGSADLELGTKPAEAGFSAVTTPEATVEAIEYREGTYIYARKFPGNVTVSDITLSRGVARKDSSFWNWLRVVIEGKGEYRVDMQIKQYHRDTSLPREFPAKVGTGGSGNSTLLNTEKPARIYHCKEGLPTRHKVAGDLDATSSDISIMELDVAIEHFEVEEISAT